MAQPILAAYNKNRGLPRRVRPLMAGNWYRLGDFIRILNNVRDNNPSLVATRQQMMAELNNLRVPVPFTPTNRFPDNEEFVCELYGNWVSLFQQLKAALAYKDKDNIGDRGDTKPNGGTTKPGDTAASDSFTAVWNATTNMLDKCIKMEDILNRYEFETFYKCTWSTRVNAEPGTAWVDDQPQAIYGDEI